MNQNKIISCQSERCVNQEVSPQSHSLDQSWLAAFYPIRAADSMWLEILHSAGVSNKTNTVYRNIWIQWRHLEKYCEDGSFISLCCDNKAEDDKWTRDHKKTTDGSSYSFLFIRTEACLTDVLLN